MNSPLSFFYTHIQFPPDPEDRRKNRRTDCTESHILRARVPTYTSHAHVRPLRVHRTSSAPLRALRRTTRHRNSDTTYSK